MISKNHIKLLNSLQNKKFRKEHGLFVVEGLKSVLEVAASDFEILEVIYNESDEQLEAVLQRLPAIQKKIKPVSVRVLQQVSFLERNETALALVKIPTRTETYTVHNNRWHIALDHIQDPGNLGTILRTADWFGFSSVVCTTDTVDVYNPKVLQASMGSFCRVKVFYEDLTKILASCVAKKLLVFGTFAGEGNLEKLAGDEGVLVLGNEANGIRPYIHKFITHKIGIRKYGMAESLNVGVATGILLHQLRK